MLNRILGIGTFNQWGLTNYNKTAKTKESQEPGITKIDGNPINLFKRSSEIDSIWTAELDGNSYACIDNKKGLYPQNTVEDIQKMDQQVWNYFKNCAEILGVDPKRVAEAEQMSKLINNDLKPKTGNRISFKG